MTNILTSEQYLSRVTDAFMSVEKLVNEEDYERSLSMLTMVKEKFVCKHRDEEVEYIIDETIKSLKDMMNFMVKYKDINSINIIV